MSNRERYQPGPASPTEVHKNGDKWTFVLVRELCHSPEKVWEALTDPDQLRRWAPYDADDTLAETGTVNLTWVGTGRQTDVRVVKAEPPTLLEFDDMRWQLERTETGTKLTLWASIDRRYISMGAAGWHIALDVLARDLDGPALGRIVGPDVMKLDGWKRLTAEYAQQFGKES